MAKKEEALTRAQVLARKGTAAATKTRKDGSTYSQGVSFGGAPKTSPAPKTRPAVAKKKAAAKPAPKKEATITATKLSPANLGRSSASGNVGTGTGVKRTVNTDDGPITSGRGKVTARKPGYAKGGMAKKGC